VNSGHLCGELIERVDHIRDDQEVLSVIRWHRWRCGGSYHDSFRGHGDSCVDMGSSCGGMRLLFVDICMMFGCMVY
jgi:hypothetical protein